MVRGLLTVEVVAADQEEVACLAGAAEGLASTDLDVVIGDIVPITDVDVELRHTASACNVVDKPVHIINEDVATVGGKVEGIAENTDRRHILGDDAAAAGSPVDVDCNLDVDLYTAWHDHSHSKGGVIGRVTNYKAIDATVNTGDVAAVAGYNDSSIATIITINLPDKHISLWVVDLAFLMVSLPKTTDLDAIFNHSQHSNCCKLKSCLDAVIMNDKTDCCSTVDDAHCF